MTITIQAWVLWLIGVPIGLLILFFAFIGFMLRNFKVWR